LNAEANRRPTSTFAEASNPRVPLRSLLMKRLPPPLRKRKLLIRTRVRVPPRLPKPPKVVPRRVRPRRSHGPRLRLRTS
jgi:hypothetical protein